MDGQTFLKALRETHRVAALPIVIVSASKGAADQDVKKIVKNPISATSLTHLVREFCG